MNLRTGHFTGHQTGHWTGHQTGGTVCICLSSAIDWVCITGVLIGISGCVCLFQTDPIYLLTLVAGNWLPLTCDGIQLSQVKPVC